MPVISNLSFSVTDTTIVATWTTDTSSDSNLSAGGKAAIDNGVAANSTSHQCIVTGLSPSTLYSCVVTSGGSSSSPQNVTTSAPLTRTPITGASIGTPYTSAGNADVLYNIVSNDGSNYVMSDDTSGIEGATINANVAIQKFTNESLLTGVNVNNLSGYGPIASFNGTDGPAGAALTNKGCGIWAQNGSLFLFIMRQIYNGTAGVSAYYQAIIRSDDHGLTWNNFVTPGTFGPHGLPPYPPSPSPYMFTNPNFGFVSPVLYAADDGTLGYNTPGNQIDGANAFVYMFFMDTAHVNNSQVFLARMPRIRLQNLDYSATQFWIGSPFPTPANFVNDSNWTTSTSGLTPIYIDGNPVVGGGTGRVSRPAIAYIPAINYYVMMNWYRPQGQGVTSDTIWNVLVAPTPAGPWKSILSTEFTPTGWYNPCFMHRSVCANTNPTAANVSLIFSGDFSGPYYHPSISTLALTTGGQPVPTGIQIVGSPVEGQQSTNVNTLVMPAVNIPVGATVVIGVRTASNATLSSISPNSPAWSFGNQGGTGALKARFGYIENHPGGAGVVYTVTASAANNNWWGVIWICTGIKLSTSLDQQATGNNSGTSPITAGSLTTTQADEIMFAIAGLNSSGSQSGATWTVTSPTMTVDFQPFVASGSQACGVAAHLIVSSIQSGVATSAAFSGGTVGSPTLGVIQTITFKAALDSISGNAGVAGATVAYSGSATGSVVADGLGNYSISSLLDGTYTITPSKTGFVFSPTSQVVTLAGSNVSGINFTASSSGGGSGTQGDMLTVNRWCSRMWP